MNHDQAKEFKPTFYARYPLETMSPSDMDRLLENGYYRNGLDACASSVRYLSQEWASAVMLRVRLKDFAWKKRLRKLLRINGEKFSHHIQQYQPNPQQEVLWQRFKSNVHGWHSIPNLASHLLRNRPANQFNTWELCVYDGAKLIALSIFDKGQRGLSSLEAAYDIEYNKFSPGLYTMLLEIEHCLSEGLDFYYPGFFPKDNPMFEYKLRPGNVEFFRVETSEWLPIEAIAESDWKLEELMERQHAADSALHQVALRTMPAYYHGIYTPCDQPMLQTSCFHLLVWLTLKNGVKRPLFISWNLAMQCYQVFEGKNILPEPRQLSNGGMQVVNFHDVASSVHLGDFGQVDDLVLFIQQLNKGITLHA